MAQIVVRDGAGTNVPGAPSGWSSIRQDSATDGNQLRLTSWLYYKTAGSSEPSSYSWSISSQSAAGVMGAWRGVGGVLTPLDGDSGAAVTGLSPVSDAAPSLTPNVGDELQVYFYGAQSPVQGPTITLPGALTQRFNTVSSMEGFALGFADLAAPSAGTASPTYTATASGVSSAAFSAQAVILMPESFFGSLVTL